MAVIAARCDARAGRRGELVVVVLLLLVARLPLLHRYAAPPQSLCR